MPFRAVLHGSLASLLSTHQLQVEENHIAAVLNGMAELDPHPDAHDALAVLASQNLRIVALSNGATSTTEKLLLLSGLDQFVEAIYSVDQVQQFKPRREVYLHVASASGLAPGEIMLVATHACDIHGASGAGLKTGFAAREQSHPCVMRRADVEGQTLLDVARAIIETRQSSA